ncbi:MAG TPA: 7-cyano-7-deazaguanine synthase [Nitrososphaerales archaeon]|nr:7-cyano-7-deazaguanine synthase [Nitrososphaerales archaeon]
MINGRYSSTAIALLSGGIDSAVALYWALKVKRFNTSTLTFDYYRRSKKEIVAAERISRAAGCRNLRLRLEFLKELDDIRSKSNKGLEGVESSYIPARNIIFYGIACSVAEPRGCRYIVGGHNKDDVKSFPDSSPNFFAQFNRLSTVGLFSGARTGRVILPLSHLRKSAVIKLGKRLGVPFELTWSCYYENPSPCGMCHACRLRESAFISARVEDPLQKSR